MFSCLHICSGYKKCITFLHLKGIGCFFSTSEITFFTTSVFRFYSCIVSMQVLDQFDIKVGSHTYIKCKRL